MISLPCNCIVSYFFNHIESKCIINYLLNNLLNNKQIDEKQIDETQIDEKQIDEKQIDESTDIYIYILELSNNKYYIGKTTNPTFRIEQHFNTNGSAWCKKYKPIKLLKLISNCDDFDEDKYTLKYMKEKGIINVRGGSFCQIILNYENLITIERMINGSTNCCYICSKKGHFANQCKSDKAINNNTHNSKYQKIGYYANQCNQK